MPRPPLSDHSSDVLFACEVLIEDRTWQPGEVLATQDTERGIGALVRWEGITAWLFRAQGRGRPNEWRRLTDASGNKHEPQEADRG